jgi:hypothetical protein
VVVNEAAYTGVLCVVLLLATWLVLSAEGVEYPPYTLSTTEEVFCATAIAAERVGAGWGATGDAAAITATLAAFFLLLLPLDCAVEFDFTVHVVFREFVSS